MIMGIREEMLDAKGEKRVKVKGSSNRFLIVLTVRGASTRKRAQRRFNTPCS